MVKQYISNNLLPIKKYIIFFALLFIAVLSNAQQKTPYRQWRLMHRLSLGYVASNYQNNKNHTTVTKAKPGVCISYKSELFLGRKTNLLIGLEYLNHGLSFKGYYDVPGYTYLYDKSFAYTHEFRIQEVQMPIALKLAFNREKTNVLTPYVFGGVGARYIFKSYAFIGNDSTGTSVYDNKSTVDFEYQFVTKGLNAFFLGGVGLQKNFRQTARAAFFELTYKYSISRLHYTGYQNSNNLYIKDGHLAFLLGLRF
jgi:hypothetical protein